MKQMHQETQDSKKAEQVEAVEVPTEVNDTSAEVSEDAACCLASIDEVLEEAQVESDEETAQRLYAELGKKYTNNEISWEAFDSQLDELMAKYAHTNAFSCVCR